MLVVTGTVAVLLTWAVAATVVVALGLPWAAAAGARTAPTLLRHALWWGVLTATVLALVLSLVTALASPGAAATILALAATSGAAGWRPLRRAMCRPRRGRAAGPPLRPLVALAAAGTGSVVVLAASALGPVTNYDSGLYHLGAIRYAAEFPAVPGLASLYEALGAASAQFPLAALLGGFGWGLDGARLLNGLLLALLVLDLWLRLLGRERGPGSLVMAVGMVTAFVPMVALADYWVTSPSQDAAALVLCVAAMSLLAEAVVARRPVPACATAIAAGAAAGAIRPTMGAFAVGVILACAAIAAYRRAWSAGSGTLAVLAVVSAAAAVIARDRILSGWLLFPSSAFPLDVAWRSPDPALYRLGTLGYHRDAEAMWDAADGWAWVPAWLGRLPTLWETAAVAALALAAITAIIIAAQTTTLRVRALAVVLVAPVVGVFGWWTLTPPSPRFAWGPLLMVPGTALGWALWRLMRTHAGHVAATRAMCAGAVGLAAVAVACLLTRTEFANMTQERTVGGWPLAVAPLPQAQTRTFSTADGLVLQVPAATEQCWSTWPLCTPKPDATLRTLKGPWQRGFATGTG